MDEESLKSVIGTMKRLAKEHRETATNSEPGGWMAGFYSGRAGAYEQCVLWCEKLIADVPERSNRG